MPDERSYFHSLMRGMVARHFPNKQNCAAREIAEYWAGRELDDHEVDYGGFSRKMRGSRDWSFNDVLALTSITGSRRILEAMEAREKPGVTTQDSIHMLAARAAKESGEGIEAALNERDLPRAYSEADDAVKAWTELRDRVHSDIERGAANLREVS